MQAEDRSTERGTVSWLVRRHVAGRTDITENARQQYEWAIPHIENGLGAIPLATLDRKDVARWIEARRRRPSIEAQRPDLPDGVASGADRSCGRGIDLALLDRRAPKPRRLN